MNLFLLTWEWLLPAANDVLLRGRGGLVLASCLSLGIANLAMIVIWKISKDLERNTVAGSIVYLLALVGIGSLAHNGQVLIAAWLLVGLQLLLTAGVVASYGVASSPAATFIFPIALAAGCLGFWPALGAAMFTIAVIWGLVWAELTGRHTPTAGRDISHLTYDAPTLTLLFLATAIVFGVWSDSLMATAR